MQKKYCQVRWEGDIFTNILRVAYKIDKYRQ